MGFHSYLLSSLEVSMPWKQLCQWLPELQIHSPPPPGLGKWMLTVRSHSFAGITTKLNCRFCNYPPGAVGFASGCQATLEWFTSVQRLPGSGSDFDLNWCHIAWWTELLWRFKFSFVILKETWVIHHHQVCLLFWAALVMLDFSPWVYGN